MVAPRGLDGRPFTGRAAAVLTAAQKQMKLPSPTWCTAAGAEANGWTVHPRMAVSVPGSTNIPTLKMYNVGLLVGADYSPQQSTIRMMEPAGALFPFPRDAASGATFSQWTAHHCLLWAEAKLQEHKSKALSEEEVNAAYLLCPFWATRSVAREIFSTDVTSDAVLNAPVTSKVLVNNTTVGSTGKAVHDVIYHASQMQHPERFTEEYCAPLRCIRLDGKKHDSYTANAIRAHIIKLGFRCESIWDSRENMLTLAGIDVEAHVEEYGAQIRVGRDVLFPNPKAAADVGQQPQQTPSSLAC